MANGFEQKSFKAQDFLIKEGAPSDAAYLVTEGKVEVRKGAVSSNPQTLAVLGKGAVIGEMSLFDDQLPVASAIAIEDTTTTAISREEFQRRLSSMDPVMRGIFKIMVNRVRELTQKKGTF
ncbi:MAG: cyclic nucleotide-binding domain-containing protein [Alphaproteobacteria bacterium]|nr:cyclic nucleotide-binding domain-containing protein [Alphaproteobacteria bacterium]